MSDASGNYGSAQGSSSSGRKTPLITGCLLGILGLGAAGLLLVLVVGALMVAGVVSGAGGAGQTAGMQFVERTVRGTPGRPKVAVIPLRGMITGSAGMEGGPSPVEVISAQLERARQDAKVKAIVLEINSGGGSITASDIMLERLRSYREQTGDPVVGCMMDVAASGALYVAAGCDRIMAHPTTITGSIGVLMPLYDATDLMKKIGVDSETVKSGALKTMGSPFETQSEAEREKARGIFQNLVDEMHQRFVQVLAEGRGLDPKAVQEVADGRILSSRQALEHKLIDDIGYQEDAVDRAEKMAGISDAHVVEYRRVMGFSELMGRLLTGPDVNISLGNRPMPAVESCPMYLWHPSLEKRQ